MFGGYTSKEIRDLIIKVYHNNKKTITYVISSCMSRQPEVESDEESRLLE